MSHVLCCPHCGSLLSLENKVYTCEGGHTFDLSARRYVNLLIDQSAATHGDDRAMILARRQFLTSGLYEPLRRAVAGLVRERMPREGVLLDAGCGEGWYTEAICEGLSDRDGSVHAYGIDISKEALRYAGTLPCVRQGYLTLAVASAYKMPVNRDSVDMVVNLFAPFAVAEYARVLCRGGYLLYVVPERRHLWGLKEVLYDTPYENRVDDPEVESFSLVSQQLISEEIEICGRELIDALFGMTPYYHRTPKAGRDRLKQLEILKTPIEFRVFLYQKQ